MFREALPANPPNAAFIGTRQAVHAALFGAPLSPADVLRKHIKQSLASHRVCWGLVRDYPAQRARYVQTLPALSARIRGWIAEIRALEAGR